MNNIELKELNKELNELQKQIAEMIQMYVAAPKTKEGKKYNNARMYYQMELNALERFARAVGYDVTLKGFKEEDGVVYDELKLVKAS